MIGGLIAVLSEVLISINISANALAVDWSPGDQADIAAAERFFNSLDTYRAQFVQISPEGSYSKGWLWLQRPHYLRVEYAPPTNLLLVANGTFLIFMDRDIGQVSKYSYGYSRHSFPLSPNLSSNRIMFKEPKRGDVIVFKTPADNRTDYIKRLIGLPGDTIQIIDKNLYLNDVPNGGTEFFHQKYICEAKKGKILIFPANFAYSHRGQISMTHEKYILTGWLGFA